MTTRNCIGLILHSWFLPDFFCASLQKWATHIQIHTFAGILLSFTWFPYHVWTKHTHAHTDMYTYMYTYTLARIHMFICLDSILLFCDGPNSMARLQWWGIPHESLHMLWIVRCQLWLTNSSNCIVALTPKSLITHTFILWIDDGT